jgi:Flp pilus assembly protein TadG
MTTTRRQRLLARLRSDEGTVDVSIEMMFVFTMVMLSMLFVVEVVICWHARNILEQAAAEGARYAAAHGNTCADGIPRSEEIAARFGGAWVKTIEVHCQDGDLVTVRVDAKTPAFMLGWVDFPVAAVASAPKEN